MPAPETRSLTSHAAPHVQPVALLLVIVGGTVGSALRAAIAAGGPTWNGLPLATVTVNLIGAFALGALGVTLAARLADGIRRHRLLRLLGTGLIGGFTTYSAFAVETLWFGEHLGVAAALGYGLGQVALGIGLAGCGAALAARLVPRREQP